MLGGWIEAAGTMLGFELTIDGNARVGTLVRGESSLPMVSGRYGLGWSVAHGGHQTTDGGMTWTSIPVPDPVSPPRAVTSRACGPIGCSAAGWLRIGWGTAGPEPTLTPHQVASPPRSHLSLPLECDWGDAPPLRKAPSAREDVLGAAPATVTAGDARVLTFDTSDALGQGAHNGLVGRIFAWGARSGDWEHGTKWMVRWDWPFGGSSDVRSSLPSSAPALVLDAARASSSALFSWSLALGDDPSHALLVSRRSVRGEGGVFELEADHAPLEIKRANGEPIGELDAAVRAAGRWYLATAPQPTPANQASPTNQTAGRAEAVIWQVDGPVARELARIPRIPRDARSSTGLALRADGRTLGYVVDGQPLGDRTDATRWVAAIDLDTGVVGDIEPLGSFDFGDRTAINPCTNDDLGWSMDSPDGPVRVVSHLARLPGNPPRGSPRRPRPSAPRKLANVRRAPRRIHRNIDRRRRSSARYDRPTRFDNGRGGRWARAARLPVRSPLVTRHCRAVSARAFADVHEAKTARARKSANTTLHRPWHAVCTGCSCSRGVRLPPRSLCAGTFLPAIWACPIPLECRRTGHRTLFDTVPG